MTIIPNDCKRIKDLINRLEKRSTSRFYHTKTRNIIMAMKPFTEEIWLTIHRIILNDLTIWNINPPRIEKHEMKNMFRHKIVYFHNNRVLYK